VCPLGKAIEKHDGFSNGWQQRSVPIDFTIISMERRPQLDLVKTPRPPYFAVIFSSRLTADAANDYGEMADRMLNLAQAMPGFLGFEKARNPNGNGITVSYWASEDAIRLWQQHAEHLVAQKVGRERWYAAFETRVARVERSYGYTKPNQNLVPLFTESWSRAFWK
jgi:heme-degrading monooxygenase HmoA